MQTLDAEKKEASGVALEQKKDALTVTDRRTTDAPGATTRIRSPRSGWDSSARRRCAEKGSC